jgi:hypothetical protein
VPPFLTVTITAARAAIEPEFESLRGDDRFQRLMVRIAPSG